jgi:hypothetical protein
MRQTISGLFAAFAVLFAGAAPAMACGYSTCAPTYYAPVYAAPTYAFGTGCGNCGGGWAYQRLAEPQTQYYYVNQGPTFTGPGAYAPYPTYHETAVTGWAGYERAPSYGGYETPAYYGYRWHHRYHAWHHGYRYGYHHVLRRYY